MSPVITAVEVKRLKIIFVLVGQYRRRAGGEGGVGGEGGGEEQIRSQGARYCSI